MMIRNSCWKKSMEVIQSNQRNWSHWDYVRDGGRPVSIFGIDNMGERLYQE